jgi:hypothetical protein
LEPILSSVGSFTRRAIIVTVLLAPLTGQLVADLVTGTEPAVDLAPFSPARFEVGSDYETPESISPTSVLASLIFPAS